MVHELYNSIPEPWKTLLASQTSKLNIISNKLQVEPYIPSLDLIFKALSLPPQDIKVIIIGQDPYPNPLHACGSAFSVPADVKNLPPSLRNIFKELHSDLGIINTSGDLSPWQAQGVLLLNRILTSTPNSSFSHATLGWQEVTDEIIKIILPYDPVAILWGAKAQKLTHYFNPARTITSSHPSPLSARHSFFGSKPFSRSNEILIKSNKQPINWQT